MQCGNLSPQQVTQTIKISSPIGDGF